MADETTIVDRWLFATLGARDELTAELLLGADSIHNTEAPAGDDGNPPYVLFQFQGGSDVRGVGPTRIGITGLWVVRGVVETRDFLDVETIANEIDTAIEAGAGTAEDGFVFACVREAPYRMRSNTDGHDFRELGGIYRLFAQRPPS